MKLKRTIFTSELYFLESLFLELMRCGIWRRKQLLPHIPLFSGRKVTCLQVGKLTQTTWSRDSNSASSSEDSSKYCCLAAFFFRRTCRCMCYSALHLPRRPRPPPNAYRQIRCCFAFSPTTPVFSPASFHAFWL